YKFGSYLETKNDGESRNEKNTKANTVIENNDDLKETQSEEKEEEGQQQREEMEADIDKSITKKDSIKIPWKKRTPKIIKKGEIYKIWYSQQLTKKQLQRLESLKVPATANQDKPIEASLFYMTIPTVISLSSNLRHTDH
ncbi:hypothetical protein RFI_28317, partial [Reticulomyxa filosa]